jgi:hypothetical protein
MQRKPGERLKHKEVKMSILKRILSNKKEISEPDIRAFLEKEYGLIDQGTINRHLHSLQKEFGCLEKIMPTKKGLRNKWEVKNIENLNNIWLHFPEIQLNKYAKALNLIFYEMGLEMNSIWNIKLYAQLSLSNTFFNLVLDKGRKNIYPQIWEIYKDKHSTQLGFVKKSLLDFHLLYIKSNPKTNISVEELENIINQIAFTQEKLSPDVWNKNFSNLEKVLRIDKFLFVEKEVSDRLNSAMKDEVCKIVNDKHSNLKSLPQYAAFDINKEVSDALENLPREELCENLFIDIYNEIYPEHEESNNREILTDRKMYIQLNEMISQMHKIIEGFQYYRFNFLLEHCYNQDKLTGVASKEELEFVGQITNNFDRFVDNQRMWSSNLKESQKTKTEEIHENLENTDFKNHEEIIYAWVLADLKTVSEIFVEYQLPLPSGEVHKKVEDAYYSLTQFFKYAIPTNNC